MGRGDFRIRAQNGRTGHHNLGAGDVLRPVALKDDGAQLGEPLGDRGKLEVGAGNFVAEGQQHLGDAAHADPADAHEMDTLDFCKH